MIIPAAALGPESSLPEVNHSITPPPSARGFDESRGYPPNIFPYRMRDGYSAELAEHTFTSVVLENDLLRAVVLPELGGRIWSLQDRVSGAELIYRNQTVRIGNLALRNAWFAGGIEYNIGTRGHSPHTCEPLHAALVDGADGTPSLRLWEFERLRQVVYQIDLMLPAGSPVLLAHVRIRNPNAVTVPMYWWTNAAVAESADSAVVTGSATALWNDYVESLHRLDVAAEAERISRPARNVRAIDYFFEPGPDDDPCWLGTVDADGNGLALMSTSRQPGRKLFCWGSHPGGQQWQRLLSPHGGRYFEVQAGLAVTQFEHLPMPAGETWSWIEAYGNAGLGPETAHGADWDSAVRRARHQVADLWPSAEIRSALIGAVDLPPDEIIQHGSGWGALERLRREHGNLGWIDETATPFSAATLGPDQEPWIALLNGADAAADPTRPPVSDLQGEDWERLLAARPDSWSAQLQLAVMLHARRDLTAAEEHYRISLDLQTNAWAHRGLALICADTGRAAAGVDHLRVACQLVDDVHLLEEAAEALLTAGKPAEALRLMSGRSAGARQGRIELLRCRAMIDTGDLAGARALLDQGIDVPDLREGETKLSDLWQAAFGDRPVPERYEFRMA